jgi:FKBP-type peptidyl-prolyl cis-trans isomerase
VLREGDGLKPNETDRVKVHYRSTGIDGTELAGSYRLGEPMIMPVKDKPLMAAWTEGLQLMRVGSKYRLFIPPNLGFREGMGFGGPKATLILELELLGIQK